MVIVYGGKWRWIPLHNVYWLNSNFRTARANDNSSKQEWQVLRSVIVINTHTNTHQITHTQLSTKLRKPPFPFTRIINYIYMFFVVSVLYWVIQFPTVHISTSIHWINLISFVLTKLFLFDFFIKC